MSFGGSSGTNPQMPVAPPEVAAPPPMAPIFNSPSIMSAGTTTTARPRQNPSILTAGLGGMIEPGKTAKKSLLGA